MASRAAVGIALGLILVAAGVGGYVLWRRADVSPIVGIVRATEVRVAPEVGGQLAAIKVQKGARVRAGDVVAELSALELTASVEQARAALAAARANRDNVYAGVRAEEVARLASEIEKAKSRLAYAQSQLDRATYLARSDYATQQTLDQATNDVASARCDAKARRPRAETHPGRGCGRPDKRRARHRRHAGGGRRGRPRRSRAPPGKNHSARARRRRGQRDCRRGRREHPRRPAGAGNRASWKAMAVLQRTGR